MNDKHQNIKVAQWLVVGFVKNWSFSMLNATMYQAFGKNPKAKFLPDASANFVGSSPVRGYVYANWPKLGAFLETASPEKQIKAAEEIVKLKWNGNLAVGAINKTERAEMDKTRSDLRKSTTSYRESRATFQNSRGTNWNQCK